MSNSMDRTVPFNGTGSLEALSKPWIAFDGLNEVGGGAFLNLVRCGVRRFRLAETEVFRQTCLCTDAAAFDSTLNELKIEVYARLARGICSALELELYFQGTTPENMGRFVEGGALYVSTIHWEHHGAPGPAGWGLFANLEVPIFTAGVLGFGAVMVNYHPQGMKPGDFWTLAEEKSTGSSCVPSCIMEKFDPPLMRKVARIVEEGRTISTSIGSMLAGTVLATEVMGYLLADTDFMSRKTVFAPQFLVVDLLTHALQVMDITKI